MGYYKGKIELGTSKLYGYSQKLADDLATLDDQYEYEEVDVDFPDFNDIVQHFQREDNYRGNVYVGSVIMTDPVYYTEQFFPGEQPEIFDEKTPLSTLSVWTDTPIQNDSVENYGNAMFSSDDLVLFHRQGDDTNKRITNDALWWIPIYPPEFPEGMKYPRQQVTGTNGWRPDASLFEDKKKFLWGENNPGVHSVYKNGERTAAVSRNLNFTYLVGQSLNLGDPNISGTTYYPLQTHRPFYTIRQTGLFTTYDSLFAPVCVRWYDSQNTYRVSSLQKQPDGMTDGLEYGLQNLWTISQCGIALDVQNRTAYWIIPDMLQYDSPSDLTSESSRQRRLYSRIIMQPIFGRIYSDASGTYTDSKENAFKLILDIFFNGEEPEKEQEESYDDEELELPENKGGNGTYQRSMQTDMFFSNGAIDYTVGNGKNKIYVMKTTAFPNESDKLEEYQTSVLAMRYHSMFDDTLAWVKEAQSKIADVMEKGALRLYTLPVALGEGKVSNPFKWFVGGWSVGVNTGNDDGFWDWFNGEDSAMSQARHVLVSELTFLVDISRAFYKFYDTYADYVPHTDAVIYLPYIGWQSIPLNNLYDFDTIQIRYKIAVMTGAVVCSLEAVVNDEVVCLDTWTGNCATDIPLVQTDITGLMGGAMNFMTKTLGKLGGAALGIIAGGGTGAALGASIGENVANNFASANDNAHISINTTNPSGLEGYMLPQNIYVTFHRANVVPPENLTEQKGETLFAGTNIRNLHGYTEIAEVQLKCSATNEEKDEIVSLLRGGVILP